MNPVSPKKEEDISAALDSWLEEVSLVEAHGSAYSLPAVFKITSLRIIMDVKRDKFDDMCQACKRVNLNLTMKSGTQHLSRRSGNMQETGDWKRRHASQCLFPCRSAECKESHVSATMHTRIMNLPRNQPQCQRHHIHLIQVLSGGRQLTHWVKAKQQGKVSHGSKVKAKAKAWVLATNVELTVIWPEIAPMPKAIVRQVPRQTGMGHGPHRRATIAASQDT